MAQEYKRKQVIPVKKPAEPYWIRHTHFLAPDTYECSACGAVSRRKLPVCPGCGAAIRRVLDRLEWLDEAEETDLMDS